MTNESNKSTADFIEDFRKEMEINPPMLESDLTIDIPDVTVPLPTFSALCRLKGAMEVVAHVVRNAEQLDLFDDLIRQASKYADPGDEPIKETSLETVLKLILGTPSLRLSEEIITWTKENSDA